MQLNPFTGVEIVENFTMNMTQYLQLRQDILIAEQNALFTGLMIGCIVGALGTIIGIWYISRFKE